MVGGPKGVHRYGGYGGGDGRGDGGESSIIQDIFTIISIYLFISDVS